MSTVHTPRDYQVDLINGIRQAWQTSRYVAAVLPTGGGKTFVFSSMIESLGGGAACAIAHRKELVSQMSLALAREGVRHRIIGSKELRKQCVALHIDELGRDYHLANSPVAAAGVDTLLNHDANDPWLKQVRLWVQDEAHHVLKENKWGRACAMFPNAWGLGVTATLTRADGKGLGSDSDGLFEAMVVGPSMRELINRGYLTDYKIYAPPSDIDLSQVNITESGEYSPEKLRKARRKSCLTGDVVDHYIRLAKGKLAVVFDVDVESATETAAAFRGKGIPAEVISAKTPDNIRVMLLRQFKDREIHVLVNVDLFGEGFDLPAIEVVSMARPTASYALFAQQFGRALRILAGKEWAIIIDHVGNVARHGLPDARQTWTLDRRERRSRSAATDAIPTRTCMSGRCDYSVYERYLKVCPYCGEPAPITNRSAPEYVEGDLVELDPAVLAVLRGEAQRLVDAPRVPFGVPSDAQAHIYRTHQTRAHHQQMLREQINLWSGWQAANGRDQSNQYRRFYHGFGIDVATAMTLNANDAAALCAKIAQELAKNRVVDARSVHGV